MIPIRLRPTALVAATLLLVACAGRPPGREADESGARPTLAASGLEAAVVAEAFASPPQDGAELDSLAAWWAPDGRRQVIATAKETHELRVFDGGDGALLRAVGGPGEAPGRFRRPNGVAVWGDRVFVVERDNRRVQVLSLPDFRPLATFGEAELRAPYGLWLHEPEPGRLEAWVTDSWMLGEAHDRVPPAAELAGRLKRYQVLVDGDAVSARFDGAFGPTAEATALHLVESVAGDPAHDHLLVAEEDAARGTGFRRFGLDGALRAGGIAEFAAQAEGLALWACADGSGYWIGADQFPDHTLFRVFDRATLAPRGAFRGETTAATDGIVLQQGGDRRFPDGVVYAVDDDRRVAAFDWRDLARALGLRPRCD